MSEIQTLEKLCDLMKNAKPRTLEDVLREFNNESAVMDEYDAFHQDKPMNYKGEYNALVSKYAAERRELMGGGRMSETLKPCPFCGGEAKPYKYFRKYLIECEDCKEYGHGAYVAASTEAEAIEAWNSRAERTCENAAKSWGEFECSVCGMYADFGSDLHRVNVCPNCESKVIA